MYLRQVLFRFTFTAAAHLLLLLCRKITLKRKITLMIRLQLRKVWSHSTRRGESSPFKFHYMSGGQVLVLEGIFSSQMGTLSTRCWCCGQSIFTSGLENGQFRVPDPPVAISVGWLHSRYCSAIISGNDFKQRVGPVSCLCWNRQFIFRKESTF